MPLFVDRVKETSTTAGTGPLTLNGASAGFRTFDSAVGVGNKCYYVIEDQVDTSKWEIGVGTIGAGGTLQRTKVDMSSAGAGVAENFAGNLMSVYSDWQGKVLGEWTSFTPSAPAGGWTTNVSYSTSWWRLRGDHLFVRYVMFISAAPGPAVTHKAPFPSTLFSIDSTKLPATGLHVVGEAQIGEGGIGHWYGKAIWDPATALDSIFSYYAGVNSSLVKLDPITPTVPRVLGASDSIFGRYSVPVVRL